MAKESKTNAMRILDRNKIMYTTHSYENKDGKIDGVAVAHKIDKDVNSVFKTLVTQGHSKEFYVFVIPVAAELDMKKCSKVAGEKNIEMIHVKDINKITGYIRGGCSPLGMKKAFKTFIQKEALLFETIVFSGGKIGAQIEMNPLDLEKVIDCSFMDVIK
ncbi:Cys-tRNA(Pro) deacylase [Clostridium saccharobutylicum]|uniref:Cys-tRNA(Pro)/Cys-tRNA(Cys) deacylase n=2 Tax=Clostridium saccharobutylicum TaxID=169679 RepID=U5MQY7_CLOSA|nr:Cys-tRNA(Pro) deacylase [Clostridium saccharobutylicum]AGX43219.1 putative Cys-tRNA(Pro)/Cys-tRNA(Cys) deacylase YjdI [Clostridium saccharobutylicum DSM 13864]AQR90518.1 Cys-tRNA(Pro)/Cys-tRNA(Cys) deacylase YbaK [Clostridium saccharobutylicum]AQS00424.1 Cys-tRNA(Pro)/Cys-tRNA(Cys) deacylase YbaK [Clostridium saccharobutylicum]AQS10073.1 Cys-tRNA(Pro)/Cys-tRNA(Cys) deacylase YbaK [Clostridium saccharobutylicum]AQS14407.1 Cys-tRNA(Pro)/Cys-tRNA(Cys) deacylase YbaK [Clostridium saccharobutyli